jgi:uncharacterized protein (DUF2342 family)
MSELFIASTISPIDLLGEVFVRLRGMAANEPLDLATLLLPERLRAVAQEATTIMTVAEGHAEWVMRQVSTTTIPHRDDFERVIDERRRTTGFSRLFAQVSGIASKRSQYSAGLRFFEAIARADPESPRRVFRGCEGLPTAAEIKEPTLWLRRMTREDALSPTPRRRSSS